MSEQKEREAGPDCRLCKRYAGWGKPCRTTLPCVLGNQFIPDTPIYLWRKPT